MLIESISRRSNRAVSASTRTRFCLISRRRTKSSSCSLSGSGTASPPGFQAIGHHATVVVTDVRRRLRAIETPRFEILRLAELRGDVLQPAEDADHELM